MFTSTTNLIVVTILFALLGIWAFIGYRMVIQGSRLIVKAALKRFASDFGLEFWTDNSPYDFELARLMGRSRDAITNVLRRELGNVELIWFEVLVYKRKSAFYEPRVAIRRAGSSFPKFALAKRSLAGCAPLWWEMHRVPFGEDALDARLKLFADDAEAVRRLFDPSLREKIACANIPPSMIVRGNREWLLFNVKGFRSFYGWPSVATVTQDLKTFLSWMGIVIATAGLFFPIETEATTLRVPSADGLLVRGAGRDKGDTLFILAALAFWLLAAMPTLVVEGDSAAVATGILLVAALIVTGAIVSRLYKRALARTIDSLARGL
jgi:hypothetical protein